MINDPEQPNDNHLEWVYEVNPITPDPAWYAVLYAWDVDEGIFCQSAYWDGQAWNKDIPIYAHAGPFLIESTASAWAEKHDPEGWVQQK